MPDLPKSELDDWLSSLYDEWLCDQKEKHKGLYSVTKDGIRLEKGFVLHDKMFIHALISEFIEMGGDMSKIMVQQ